MAQIVGWVICCATVSAVNEVMRSSWKVPGGRSGAGVKARRGRGAAKIASAASKEARSPECIEVAVADVLIADFLSRFIVPPP